MQNIPLTFHQAGNFLHVYPARRTDEHTLNYDLKDFREEFRDLERGEGRYRIDTRLQKFLDHFFGASEPQEEH
jgi:hypothetical protein